MTKPMPRVRLGYHYCVAYTTDDISVSRTCHRHAISERLMKMAIEDLVRLRRDYPQYKFWLEESDYGDNWVKIPDFNPYDLFSSNEDELPPTAKPIQQDIPF